MRIMKVKNKSLNYIWDGEISLKFTMGKRFKNNGYTHVQINGFIYPCITMSGIVWVLHNKGVTK